MSIFLYDFYNRPQIIVLINYGNYNFFLLYRMYRLPSFLRTTHLTRKVLNPQFVACLSTSNSCNAKDLKFGRDGRSAMLKGVEILAEAVAATLGPKVML